MATAFLIMLVVSIQITIPVLAEDEQPDDLTVVVDDPEVGSQDYPRKEAIEDSTSSIVSKPGKWIKNEDLNKWWYKHTDGSYSKNAWEYINDKWYRFDANGWMLSSWQKINTKWYYLGGANDGSMKISWQKVYGKWYYLSNTKSDGSMKTGWRTVGGYTYYLGGVNDGSMKTGWQNISNQWYYMYKSGARANNTFISKYYVNTGGVWLPGVVLWKSNGYYRGCMDGTRHLDWEDKGCSYANYVANGANVWNAQKSGMIRKTSNSTEADIALYDGIDNTNVLAITYSAPVNSGKKGRIVFMVNHLNTQSETIRQHVAIHELGHALGLGHNVGTNIMNPIAWEFTQLSTKDKNSFTAAYNWLYQ